MVGLSAAGAHVPQLVRSGALTFQYREERKLPVGEMMGGEKSRSVTVEIALPEGTGRRLPEQRRLLEKIVERSIEEKVDVDSVTYRDKMTGKKWRVVKRSSFLKELGLFLERRNLSNFIHTIDSPNREEYELRRVWTIWEVVVEIFRLFFPEKRAFGDYGVDFTKETCVLAEAPSSNPFTELATTAYSEIECDFSGRDRGESAGAFTADTAFILEDNRLKLIPKEEAKNHREAVEGALKSCWESYIREIGNEKLEEAEYLAKFSFKEMIAAFHEEGGEIAPLTPEHIYRLNIISSSTNIQQLSSLAAKLAALKTRLVGCDDATLLKEYFQKLLTSNSTIWPERELRKLLAFAAKSAGCDVDNVTVGAFQKWLSPLPLELTTTAKMTLLKSAVYSVQPNDYPSLKELIEKHADLSGIFSEAEKEELLALSKAFSGKEELQPRDFIDVQQRLQLLFLRAKELSPHEKTKKFDDWVAAALEKGGIASSAAVKVKELLTKWVGKEGATVEEYIEWARPATERLSTEEVEELLSLLRPEKKELESAYSGRKIQQPIDSAYTTADIAYYKPWVDIQEFLQAEAELDNESIEDAYSGEMRKLSCQEVERRFDEFASYILCKKHLFIPHKEEGYRVGTLIRAPSTPEGKKQWYRLSRVIASHDGILNYHLEPLGSDTTLKSCVVSRSTSASPYAYESEGTLKNNANPIQDPGYRGRRHTDSYLENLRKEHTVPVWVAYQKAAAMALEENKEEEAYSFLLRATEELQKEPSFHCHRKDLHEIVKEFDGEFDDLMSKDFTKRQWRDTLSALKRSILPIESNRKEKGRVTLSQFRKVILDAAHKSSKEKVAKETGTERKKRIAKERKSCELLLRYIAKKAPRGEEGKIEERYRELIDAIGDNIYRNNDGALDDSYSTLLEEVGYSTKRGGFIEAFDKREGEIKPIVDKCTPLAAKNRDSASLKEWKEILENYAKEIGEDFDAKKKNGLLLNGHSLGGSTAQVETFLATAGSNRLPVATIHANLYDDPGFNEEDNIEQYSFMIDHLELLEKIGGKVEVYHSLDFGDPAPLCASSHLGALSTGVKAMIDERTGKEKNKLRERLNRVFPCRTRENRTTKHAMEKETNYPFKHGIRYEEMRVEHSRIVAIADSVAMGALDVDLEKDFGLIANYIKNIFGDDEGAFEIEGRALYSDPEKSVTEHNPEKAPLFLELVAKKGRGARLSKEEQRQFEECKKLELNAIYSRAQLLRQRERIYKLLSTLKDCEAEKVIQEIFSLIDLVDKERKEGKSEKMAKQILLSGYSEPLQIIRDFYHTEMRNEAKKARAHAIGGVDIAWLDSERLAVRSVNRDKEAKKASSSYGFGILHAKRMDQIRRFVGRYFFPTFMQYLYDEEIRDGKLSKSGHGEALRWRNGKNKALVVDEYGGPLIGKD